MSGRLFAFRLGQGKALGGGGDQTSSPLPSSPPPSFPLIRTERAVMDFM